MGQVQTWFMHQPFLRDTEQRIKSKDNRQVIRFVILLNRCVILLIVNFCFRADTVIWAVINILYNSHYCLVFTHFVYFENKQTN